MKTKLLSITLLLLAACGGGGGGPEVEETPTLPIVERPHLYSYTVSNDADTRSYTGKGVKVNGIIYTAPALISNSDFVVSGEIIDNQIRLFSYKSRGLVVSFTDGDQSGHHLTLIDEGVINELSLSDLDGEWFNNSSAGMFGDAVVSLVYDNGSIAGADTNGCGITGETFKSDSVIGISLVLTDCLHAGDYHGSLRVDGDSIIGAVVSESYGFTLLYNKG